jgi:transcription elongation factor GreB
MVETIAWEARKQRSVRERRLRYGKCHLREIDRRIRFLSMRLESAKVVDPKQQKKLDQVFFGASVTCANERRNVKTITIVGIGELISVAVRRSGYRPSPGR